MKILWVNPSFLDYRVTLYANLNRLSGGNFYLLYSKDRVPQRVVDKIEAELSDHAIGMSGEKTMLVGKKSDFANKYISLPYQKGLYKAIKSVKPDLIIAEGFFQWTPWAVAYARISKIPLFISYERTEHTERNCPLWRIQYRKFISRFVSGFLVNGSLTLAYLQKNGLSKGKTVISGCMCADSEGLSYKVNSKTMEEKSRFAESVIGGARKGLVYLFVGQIMELKGVRELLDAWEMHIQAYPDDYLLLVGYGTLLEKYRDQYRSLKNVKMTGGIDYDDIDNYYAIADVFVLPTLEDNWSLVIPEAMVCGLPVATSIYNGCYPELVKTENGIVFDPLNKDSLTGALAYFHRPELDLKEMGKASIAIEKEYSPEKVSQRIADGIGVKR